MQQTEMWLRAITFEMDREPIVGALDLSGTILRGKADKELILRGYEEGLVSFGIKWKMIMALIKEKIGLITHERLDEIGTQGLAKVIEGREIDFADYIYQQISKLDGIVYPGAIEFVNELRQKLAALYFITTKQDRFGQILIQGQLDNLNGSPISTSNVHVVGPQYSVMNDEHGNKFTGEVTNINATAEQKRKHIETIKNRGQRIFVGGGDSLCDFPLIESVYPDGLRFDVNPNKELIEALKAD
ncbi:MAG: hypothetical protein WC755_07415 [Candidatus Woesearchaeota archaeon]|jgi:hypothetical protein